MAIQPLFIELFRKLFRVHHTLVMQVSNFQMLKDIKATFDDFGMPWGQGIKLCSFRANKKYRLIVRRGKENEFVLVGFRVKNDTRDSLYDRIR